MIYWFIWKNTGKFRVGKICGMSQADPHAASGGTIRGWKQRFILVPAPGLQLSLRKVAAPAKMSHSPVWGLLRNWFLDASDIRPPASDIYFQGSILPLTAQAYKPVYGTEWSYQKTDRGDSPWKLQDLRQPQSREMSVKKNKNGIDSPLAFLQ